MQDEFELACINGDIETVRRFLSDSQFNPPDFWYLFRWTTINIEIIRLLLSDPRTNPVGDNRTIQEASRYGYVEIVRLLLENDRVDPAANNNEAIRYTRNVEIVKLLLADKRVNPKGEDGIRIIWSPNYIISLKIDILVFDDVLCRVENENINSIKDDALKEKYLLWLYRIGGEKHSQAVENLK